MLSEQRIEEIYYMMYCHFIDQRRYGTIDSGSNNGNCYVLLYNNRLIANATYGSSVRALAGFKTSVTYSFKFPRVRNTESFTIPDNRCWFMKINELTAKWEHNVEFATEHELKQCILLNQKVVALDKINHQVEFYRKDANDHINGQQSVYIRKYLEAKDILDKNIIVDNTLQYPFVSGYAKHKGISANEAAKIITLQYDMESSYLAESENIRTKYVDLIRAETDIVNLKEIVRDFYTEHHSYGSL